MFAEFIQYYRYTADEALGEYAKRFFALCASMYKLKAKEYMISLANQSHAFSGGKEAKKLAEQYHKDYLGTDKILQEVRNIKK
jgi:hypothetical protein